jgi:dienelactone hydrolase
MKTLNLIIIGTFFIIFLGQSQNADYNKLYSILGDFPKPPVLKIDTLEKIEINGGVRLKIQYCVEEANKTFNRPEDMVRAYLFVPDCKGNQKLPGIVAIHQDGANTHLGKKEPAGIDGDTSLFYGLELYKRGYVVICPDRMGHCERRRIPNAESEGSNSMRDLFLLLNWSGQLILDGRTYFGKETYDLMRATDVLCSYAFVDKNRLGAIGHSAGGESLVFFMFVDKRIKAGVSSCGFYSLENKFKEQSNSFPNTIYTLFGLTNVGTSADFLGYIAPRPFLMTRGLDELESPEESLAHVQETKDIEKLAMNYYIGAKSSDKLKTIYFNGGHAFPFNVRYECYNWLDKYLK